ncbi:MAG: DUF167 domain-containing protein [Acidimicrobiales bacterium]|nr:DUF167 domain-containing protein [Acidimicrobiales bacterium]
MNPPWARPAGPDALELDVWVVPGGSRTTVTGEHDGRLRVVVAAAPEGGKANRAVQQLLAGLAGVAPREVELLKGTTSRAKRWRIHTAEPAASLQRVIGAVGRAAPQR